MQNRICKVVAAASFLVPLLAALAQANLAPTPPMGWNSYSRQNSANESAKSSTAPNRDCCSSKFFVPE